MACHLFLSQPCHVTHKRKRDRGSHGVWKYNSPQLWENKQLALCFQCSDPNILLDWESTFPVEWVSTYLASFHHSGWTKPIQQPPVRTDSMELGDHRQETALWWHNLLFLIYAPHPLHEVWGHYLPKRVYCNSCLHNTGMSLHLGSIIGNTWKFSLL